MESCSASRAPSGAPHVLLLELHALLGTSFKLMSGRCGRPVDLGTITYVERSRWHNRLHRRVSVPRGTITYVERSQFHVAQSHTRKVPVPRGTIARSTVPAPWNYTYGEARYHSGNQCISQGEEATSTPALASQADSTLSMSRRTPCRRLRPHWCHRFPRMVS